MELPSGGVTTNVGEVLLFTLGRDATPEFAKSTVSVYPVRPRTLLAVNVAVVPAQTS